MFRNRINKYINKNTSLYPTSHTGPISNVYEVKDDWIVIAFVINITGINDEEKTFVPYSTKVCQRNIYKMQKYSDGMRTFDKVICSTIEVKHFPV